MTKEERNQLGKTLWDIADQLRGAMNADDFRDYMLSFLFCDISPTITNRQRGRSWEGTIPRLQKASGARRWRSGTNRMWKMSPLLRSRCDLRCTM
nr:type I restriction-modification system subunit M N-terminal domain-containing protein [Candidatus Manganitrophus noduliformans]